MTSETAYNAEFGICMHLFYFKCDKYMTVYVRYIIKRNKAPNDSKKC